MKKNVMMRLAAILLVCVLASTCGISGTYAKYVTSDNGGDSARVAKWGVTALVDGTLFSDSYKDAPTTYNAAETGDSITVQAQTEGTNIVAPGTKNENGMTITLTGTPEVDVRVVFTFEVVDNKEIQLAVGEYYDPTTGEPLDTFKIDDIYYPVVFTLTKDGNTLVSGNVAAIQAWMTANLNKDYEANTDLAKIAAGTAGVYKLTWAWAFDGAQNLNGVDFTAAQVDQADTYLGNAIAGGGAVGAVTDIEVKFTLSITQID